MSTTPQEVLSTGTGNQPPKEPREDRELPLAVDFSDPNDPNDHLGVDIGT